MTHLIANEFTLSKLNLQSKMRLIAFDSIVIHTEYY